MSMPSKSEIVEHWMYWLDKQVIDLDEPCCWACNNFWWGRYDIKVKNPTFKEIINHWNKVIPLERCHIVPKQFGGSNKVDNLFLMCKECHDKAPNTRSRTAFLHWAKQQSFVANLYKELMDEIKIYDLEDKIDQLNEMFNNGIPHQIKEDSGIHFSQLKGPKITTSTCIAAISTYLEETDS